MKQPSRIEMSAEDQDDLIVRIKQNDAISDPDKQILTVGPGPEDMVVDTITGQPRY